MRFCGNGLVAFGGAATLRMVGQFASLSFAIAVLWNAGLPLLAADAVPPKVIGFERQYAPEGGDKVAGGHLLLGELNCTSCHKADDKLADHVVRKSAPVLNTMGTRVRPRYLMKFLADPQATKPGTTMPHVMAALPEAERKEKAEALAHFLATTGNTQDQPAKLASVSRGQALYHSAGCLACHDPRPDGAAPKPLATSIVIGTPSRKYTLAGLTQFLSDPLAVRPSGRMPHAGLSSTEAEDIASFLLKDLEVVSGMQVAIYQGDFGQLPDFSKLTPKEVKSVATIDETATPLKEKFALRFDGTFAVPKDGEYKFHLGSDDGSAMAVDGQSIVSVPGVHPYNVQTGKIKLSAGIHSFLVDYFEAAGEEKLTVEVEGPDVPRQPLHQLLASPKSEKSVPAEDAFVVKSDLAAKGREYFVSLGCASCHQLNQGGGPIASTLKAKPLSQLAGQGGCLSAQPGKTPYYALSPVQVKSLSAALANVAKGVEALSASAKNERTLVRLNCISCHKRGELGGVEDERNPHFQSNMPEMGDEGRLPPALTGVGAKLKPEWFAEVLKEGTKVRPYMFTRMPRFGVDNLTGLASRIDEVDSANAKKAPQVKVDTEDKKFHAVGRKLVGGQGLSCIKCHTFADKKSTGIQALSLTTMTKRLKLDWFHNYLINPQEYRPGTRMPAAWPGGQTQLVKVLDGSTELQIRSIWEYLNEGDQAQLPTGLVTGAIELVAFDDAIMYRNFIEGAGSRAIGVGYAEKLNLAYDANQMRLALLWHGSFIDASRHWTGRGVGFEPPLGENVLKLPADPELALLKTAGAEWPTGNARELGYHFKGYRLLQARKPQFMYSLEGISVEDYCSPKGDGVIFTMGRTLKFTEAKPASGEVCYFRPIKANSIEEKGNGNYLIDNKWTLKVVSKAKPEIVDQGGKQLRIPIQFEGGKSQVDLEYDW